jgi:hypothetical protein
MLSNQSGEIAGPSADLDSVEVDKLTFNEELYLAANPDVARAVANNPHSSGWIHYQQYGRQEGRRLGPDGYALFEAVRVKTGLSVRDLALKFDSLGNDCEFGFVQRRCDAEALGLFRFSNASHQTILRAIESDFRGFGENANVELDQQKRREWMVVDREHGLRQHTFIFEGDQPEDVVRNQQLNRFRYLRAKMNENIQSGGKIFVIKSAQGFLSHDIVSAIARALRRRGPNWLLWVETGTPVGHIEVLMEGLARATIDRLTVQPDGPKFSVVGWLTVLTEAWIVIKRRVGDDSELLLQAPRSGLSRTLMV